MAVITRALLLFMFFVQTGHCNNELLQELIKRIKQLEQKGEDTTDLVKQQENRIHQLEAEIEVLKQHQCAELLKPIPNKHDEQVKRLVLGQFETVVFHATIEGGLSGHNHVSQMIVFDQVKLNVGGAYNNQTGVFEAPVPGIYMFSMSVTTYVDKTSVIHAVIKKNGAEVGAAYANGMAGFQEQGSVSVPLMLDTGDTVHVSVERHEDISLWGDKLTSFMGILVTPL